MIQNQYTITKRITKHGKQAVIIVPTMLQVSLCPGKIVEVTIREVKGGNE